MLKTIYLPNRIGEIGGKMAGLLERRDNILAHKYRTSPPRASTPPQPDINEVDEAGSMDYRFEQVRLQSFENWPCSYVRPSDLAAAGFYYTKQIDRVRCFECSTEICRWEDGDDPMVEHQRWGGRCRFIRKLPCGNVPIGADPSMIPARPVRSRDVCGPYSLDYRHGAVADTHASSSRTTNAATMQLPNAARLGCLGIGIAKPPDFPDYASYEARLQTFTEWPTSIVQTKEQLADAGFFYTGTGDQTTCYHCGGGLKNWEPQDDPWVQHAKWFSTCFYVRLVKGQEFINNVTGKHVPPLSEEEMMRINLPSCIKKVECLSMQKSDNKEEVQEQSQQNAEVQNTDTQQSAAETSTAVVESTPGPSNSEQSVQLESDPSAESTKTNNEVEVSTCTNNANNTTNQQQQAQQPNEKKPIDDARICKICYNEELSVVFLPCSHMFACIKCAPSMSVCAVCREPVTMLVRAFFS